jgi:hypothetical protein
VRKEKGAYALRKKILGVSFKKATTGACGPLQVVRATVTEFHHLFQLKRCALCSLGAHRVLSRAVSFQLRCSGARAAYTQAQRCRAPWLWKVATGVRIYVHGRIAACATLFYYHACDRWSGSTSFPSSRACTAMACRFSDDHSSPRTVRTRLSTEPADITWPSFSPVCSSDVMHRRAPGHRCVHDGALYFCFAAVQP